MELVVKYLGGDTDLIVAAEFRTEGEWFTFYSDGNDKPVAGVRADKVLSIVRLQRMPRIEDSPEAAGFNVA
jgi:hypothetical protein